MRSTLIFSLMLLLNVMAFGQSTLKTMVYNLLEYPEALPGGRDQILKNILEEYAPDILMVCELQSQEGADLVLDNSLNSFNDVYAAAPYIKNQSGSSDLQQLVYFRRDKFTLEDTQVISTDIRDINWYQLLLSTANAQTDPVLIHVFVTHLKSSQGGSNEAIRLDMVNEFTSVLNGLDADSYVLFAGDLNVYSSTEPAYQELMDPTNTIVLADPIDTPGAWHDNINFQAVHTQSTREDSGPFGAGAGGGMDDRFDFILVSENMLSDPKLRYKPDTYAAYGNNGNCFNNDISNAGCTGPYSQALRNNLFSMSDHLPVVMELETNQEILILNGTDIAATDALIELRQNIVVEALEFQTNLNSEVRNAEVYNMMGQQIMHFSINTKQDPIDVSGLAAGMYFVRIRGIAVPLKFIKI